MKKFISLKTALLLVCLFALPIQPSMAATPTQKCGVGILKGLKQILIPGLVKSAKKVCIGKATPAEEAPRFAKKYNKGVAKINKTHQKHDCETNSDPDLSVSFPTPEISVMNAQTQLEGQAALCDGIMTP